MLTAEATDWVGAADRPDFDGVDVLDAAAGGADVDLTTVDDALAVAGAPPAAVGVLAAGVDLVELVAAVLAADVDLAEFVAPVPDLPAIKGATAEMLLIFMIANL